MRNLSELLDFLDNTMSMTEIYQPVIIRYLLEKGGKAGKAELAKVLSGYDTSVQEYYQQVLMRWPKITLTKHDIITYDSKHKEFSLNFELGNPVLIEAAKEVCEEKIERWITARAARSDRPNEVASIRYRVLKAARGKCELCGISAKISPIDVDHIIPRSKVDRKGRVLKDGIWMHVDDERNLQALCFRCNRAKRDSDTTDFRLPSSKLVRDKVPEIIANEGQTPITKTLHGQSLIEKLFEKLTEEHTELLAENNIEEVADMIEVLLSIARAYGYGEDETLEFLRQKRAEKGGFNKGIFLERVQLSVSQ
jgi:predicted house-cleaning noncanonical NTP pyrophosphatase (MazG superfamily)